MEDVIKHPEFPWEWSNLSKNTNITLDIIKKYPNEKWNWLDIAANPALTPEIISYYLERFKNNFPNFPITFNQSEKYNITDMYFMSMNRGITMDYIEAHPEKNWNYHGLSQHPNLTLKMVLDHPDEDWYYYYLSQQLFDLR
jgi:hypothetical protein